jgi:hypothetical protein
MEFQVKSRELQELLKRTENKNAKVREAIRYKNEDTRTTLPASDFTDKELRVLQEVIEDRLKKVPDDRHNKWVKGRLRAYFELFEGRVTSSYRVPSLAALPVAIRRYLEEAAPRRWVFKENSDHVLLPWFVSHATFHKRTRSRDGYVSPAHVNMNILSYANGSKQSTSVSWSEREFEKTTVPAFFSMVGLTTETPEACKHYFADLEVYGKYQDVCGVQAYAIGTGYRSSSDRWYRGDSTVEMVRDGQATKVVLDPTTEEVDSNKGDDDPRHYEVGGFWPTIADTNGLDKQLAKEDEDPEAEEDAEEVEPKLEVMLPLHPYVYCFDLDQHSWVKIYTGNLQDYPWDKTLLKKLILPEDQKQLLEILISSSGKSIGDIIRGKMSGVIVLATGVPGVGKTLTAEVFSEYIEKPLYNVQCSQLGLDVDDIEKNLGEILSRASRWGAVLLIDEADVYIRRRGEDITQNAIVGVFLRLLEYYRGVLFMTSNRGDVIDDAILSRATAWIRYQLPTPELLKEIWTVLSKQFKVELTKADIGSLINKLPDISGRTVRNVLKLATMLKKNPDVGTIVTVSQYQSLESKQ